jgi:hypothetical protein
MFEAMGQIRVLQKLLYCSARYFDDGSHKFKLSEENKRKDLWYRYSYESREECE